MSTWLREPRTCQACGITFRRPWQTTGRYCSNRCINRGARQIALEIRTSTARGVDLARQHNISTATVSQIRKRGAP